LLTGNPAKIIKGTEIDDEYNAIAVAIQTKADLVSPTFTGTPLAPTASPGTNTTQLATTAFAKAAAAAAFPVGGIIMWSGTIAAIPSGWALCNGSNGTPDLRDRFIIGATQDDAGVAKTNVTGSLTTTGGSKDAIVVSHTHTATTSITDSGHTHSVPTNSVTGPGNMGGGRFINGDDAGGNVNTTSATTGITASTTVSTQGSSGTDANLPPYYSLAFIMKTV
jgi:microcystin-dependent protein